MKRIASAFAVVALGVGLAACGGGSDNAGNDTSDDSGEGPLCSDVWVKGETLPKDTDGCFTDGGDVAAVGVYDCADGSEYHFYDNKLGAAPGEAIVPASTMSDVCKGHGGTS